MPPLNTTRISSYVDITGPHGKYVIHHGMTHGKQYISWSYYSWLFTMEWIPRSQYETFRLHLVRFYQKLYPGKTMSIYVPFFKIFVTIL
jgi:hypothetical protein